MYNLLLATSVTETLTYLLCWKKKKDKKKEKRKNTGCCHRQAPKS